MSRVSSNTKPADGQLIRFKFYRPVFGKQEFTGRYWEGRGVWNRDIKPNEVKLDVRYAMLAPGKLCMWESVIEWEPLEEERDE